MEFLKYTKRLLVQPTLVALVSVFALALVATAGSLTPAAGPIGPTMNTLKQIWDSIASPSYDSSLISANANGSLIGILKSIDANSGWASGSNNIWNLNTGNVGIGTTDPEVKFETIGTASVSQLYVNSVLFNPAIAGGWTDGGTDVYLTTSTDNVGIGTSTPGYKLEIGTPGDINLSFVYAGYRIGGAVALSIYGTNNVWVGAGAGSADLAGSGNNNAAVGYQALNANTSGDQNAAVGYQALFSNTTGINNSAFGATALYANIDGEQNTAVGRQALNLNTSGSANTAIGAYSLLGNTTGFYNTAAGDASMQGNATGNFNTVFGSNALLNNTSGSSNVAVGFSAGYDAQGSGNVFLGTYAGNLETGSNTYWVENTFNTASSSALIYGEFDNDYLSFGADVSISGNFELSGTVSSHLIPTVHDTYDLGSSANRWRELYLASGSLHIGTAGDEAVIDYNVTNDYLAFKPDGSADTLRLFDTGNASLSGTFELTRDGTTANLLKLSDSISGSTIGQTNNDGDYQIRLPSVSYATEFVALEIASDSGGTTAGRPLRPVLRSVATSGAGIWDSEVRISGNYAYTISYSDSELTIFDISNPASPSQVGSVNVGSSPLGLQIAGKYAFITKYAGVDAKVIAVDISNPKSPIIVSRLAVSAQVQRIAVSGKYAYVTFPGKLQIVDISDPYSMRFVGTLIDGRLGIAGDGAEHIIVQGRYAYVISGSNGLIVIDISNPSNPAVVGQESSADGRSLYVSGRYAYINDYLGQTFRIVDVSNPSAPTQVATLASGYGRGQIYVAGDYAYVPAFFSNKFLIIDISNPLAPFIAKTVNFGTLGLNGPMSVSVSGHFAYTADGGVLAVLDLGGIEAPTLSVGNINASTLDIADNLYVGNNLFVQGGLNVGMNGLFSTGPVGISVASASEIAPFASELLRISHSVGKISGDILRFDLATSTSADRFTGNFTKFTLAGTPRFIVESSGAVLASGAAQFGAGGAPSSASYSRFGAATTTHSLTAASDLLLSGLLEADGQAYFDSNASISGNFELGGTVSSHLIPTVHDTYDLGSSANRWRDIYLASGSLHIGTAGDEAVIDYNVNDDYLAFKPDGTTRMVVTDTGNVGIASNSPTEKLSVAGNVRIEDGALWIGDGSLPFGPSPFGLFPHAIEIATTSHGGSYGNGGGISASYIMLDSGVGGPGDIGRGGVFSVTSSDGNSALIRTMEGVGAAATHMGSGTVTDLNGGFFFSSNYNLGTVTTMNGAAAQLDNEGGGTVTNASGVRIYSPFASAFTNLYGLYIEPQTAGVDSWNIYSDGATSRNLFEGSASISGNLEVTATVSFSDDLILSGLPNTDGSESYLCLDDATGKVASGSTCTPSARRYKENIQPLEHGLDWVSRLRPVTFDWKKNAKPSLGFIAEEVEEVTPLLALYQGGEIYSVNYQIMTAVLAKAIQEQQAMIDAIRAGTSSDPIPLLADDTTFLDRIVRVFDELLHIRFADGIMETLRGVFGEVQTDKLCVGNTCVTEEQLQQLLQEQGIAPATTLPPTPEASVEPTPAPSEAATPEPTPENGSPDEPFVQPSGEPVPEASSEPEVPQPDPQLPDART